jgi:hypothetical protein
MPVNRLILGDNLEILKRRVAVKNRLKLEGNE